MNPKEKKFTVSTIPEGAQASTYWATIYATSAFAAAEVYANGVPSYSTGARLAAESNGTICVIEDDYRVHLFKAVPPASRVAVEPVTL